MVGLRGRRYLSEDASSGLDRAQVTGTSMILSTKAFEPGQPLPQGCACDGDDRSPDLEWSAVPVHTRSFALVCDDPDAPRGTWVHWVLFNLPSDAVQLSPGVPRMP